MYCQIAGILLNIPGNASSNALKRHWHNQAVPNSSATPADGRPFHQPDTTTVGNVILDGMLGARRLGKMSFQIPVFAIPLPGYWEAKKAAVKSPLWKKLHATGTCNPAAGVEYSDAE